MVDALEGHHVHEAGAVAHEHRARHVHAARQAVEPAARDRLRPPRQPLAALDEAADERVGLELLQQVVRREGRVGVVEADDEAQGDHVVAHRVEPRAAVLAVLGGQPQRPAQGVDDVPEGLGNAPDLLHPELPDLGGVAVEVEVAAHEAGEVAGGALGEHGHLGLHLGAGLERRQLLAVAAAPLVAGHDAHHPPLVDQDLLAVGLGEHVRAELLGLLAHPAGELADRDDPVAVVLHLGRGRDAHLGLGAHEVDGLAGDLAVAREVVVGDVREQRLQGARPQHGARQQVRARRLALLGDGDRHLAELLGQAGVVGQQLAQAHRGRQARGPGARRSARRRRCARPPPPPGRRCSPSS